MNHHLIFIFSPNQVMGMKGVPKDDILTVGAFSRANDKSGEVIFGIRNWNVTTGSQNDLSSARSIVIGEEFA